MPNLPARIERIDRRTLAGDVPALPEITPLNLYGALLADSASDNTRNAREHDVRIFARWLGLDRAQACALFVSQGRGKCNGLAIGFRQAEQRRGVAPASINRRLATLRRLVRLARRLDLIEWECDIDGLRVTPHRDSRGPDDPTWARIWDHLKSSGDSPRARRNRALIRLLHDSALRKSEAINLDLADLDLDGARAMIRGKGSGKVWIPLSTPSVRYLREWLEARGDWPGPVFTSHPRCDARFDAEMLGRVNALRAARRSWDAAAAALNAEGFRPESSPWSGDWLRKSYWRAMSGKSRNRMPERDVGRVLDEINRELALERRVKPHGIRHRAITEALDLTNGNVREVMKYARHSKPETTMRYDDLRRDVAGAITRRVGAED